MPTYKAHGRNSGKNLHLPSMPLTKDKLGAIDPVIYFAIASSNNIILNLRDYLNETYEGAIRTNHVKIMLWAYHLRFFETKAITKQLKMRRTSGDYIQELLNWGWVEEYSPRQKAERLKTVNDEGGIGRYKVVEEYFLVSRYCLTTDARREIRKAISAIKPETFVFPKG